MTTPGPWHYEGHYILSDGPVDPDRPERGSEIIAERVSEANRGLIASAPLLFAALEELVERLDGDRNFVNPDGGAEMLSAARAALKAAGRIP